MSFGFQLLTWRRHRGLSQVALAKKAGLSRPYLSRLERDEADPALSVVRHLAGALEVHLSELLENEPSYKRLSHHELDQLARGALRPGQQPVQGLAQVRSLARLMKARRAALGLYKPRRSIISSTAGVSGGADVLRRLRADLGEAQWQALLQRIEKHASTLAELQQ